MSQATTAVRYCYSGTFINGQGSANTGACPNGYTYACVVFHQERICFIIFKNFHFFILETETKQF